MPRNITVYFSDGSAHQYNNAPDVLTPDDVETRTKRDYPNKKIVKIDGGTNKASTSLEEPKKYPGLQQQSIVDRMTGEIKGSVHRIEGDNGAELVIKPRVGILIGLKNHIINYTQLAYNYPYTAGARLKIGNGPVEKGQLWRDNSNHMGRLQFTSFFGGRENEIIKKLSMFSGEVKLEVDVINTYGPYKEIFTFNF